MSGTLSAKSTNTDPYIWIGASGGNWGTAANWKDTTTGSSPALFVPATLTPVTLAGATGSTFTVITGGGSAASIAVSGNVGASGSYTTGGALAIGAAVSGANAVSYTDGTLALGTTATLAAGGIAVVSGTLSVGAGDSLTASGAITIGSAGGSTLSGSTLLYDSGATGTVNLAARATLVANGALTLTQGALAVAGATASIAGPLILGTAATPSTTLSSTNGSQGVLAVTAGGTVTLASALTVNAGIVVVAGTGSKLVSSKTFTASNGGSYNYSPATPGLFSSFYSGVLAAANGGAVQLGGIVLNAAGTGSGFVTYYPLNISVDTTSSIEIGALGGVAAGALTIDAGKSMSANTTATVSGNVVDNGTIIASGGMLTIAGNLTGSGIVQVGKNATLQINGTVAATETIAFTDTAAALSIGSNFGLITGTNGPSAPYAVAATISGMQLGDSILIGQNATSASYAATTAGRGTLTVRNGTVVLETLTLTGIATGQAFLVSPTTLGGTAISMLYVPPQVFGTGGAASFTSGSSGGVAIAPALSVTDPVSTTLIGATVTIDNTTLTPGDVLAATTAGTAIVASYNAVNGMLSLSGKDTLVHYQAVLDSVTFRSTSRNPTGSGNTPTRNIAWTITDGSQSSSPVTTIVQLIGGNRFLLTARADSVTGTVYDDTIAAVSGALNSRDQIDGGGGSNTLQLTGAGVFDLGAPKTLSNIQAVTVTENAQDTVVYLRDGLNAAVTIASTPGGGITLYGGQDSSSISLGGGTDTIILGSATESVTGGGGMALVQATAAQAAALVNGGTGSIELEITGGGTATLNAATTHATVQLDAATNLILSKMGFVTALGSTGNDTITALAAGQILTGGAGTDTLFGYSGFGDTFSDLAAGLNGDLIQQFGGSDQIDVTDISSLKAKLSYSVAGTVGTLGLTDGIHATSIRLQGIFTASGFNLAADGHGGTQVTHS